MSSKKTVGYSAVMSVTATALLAGFILSFVYANFEKDIISNNEKAVLDGVKMAIDGAERIEGPLIENSIYPYFIGYNSNGDVLGYAFLSSGTGYNGVNKVLVGFNFDVTRITAVIPTEHAETPGLGAKITLLPFRDQFVGKSTTSPFSTVKGVSDLSTLAENQINAISGATISSASVVNAVNNAIDEARTIYEISR